MGDNDFRESIIIVIAIIELIILTYSSGIINELNQENKLLELNNSNLKTELEYHKEINKLIIGDNSKGLLEIYNLTNQINKLENERKRLINELGIEYKTQNQLKETIRQNQIKAGLINPTYEQLKDFVRKDLTNKKQWTNSFDCTEFSNEFISNFAKEGFYSCNVEIDYTKREGGKRFGHIIVAINTTDKGLIYLEPQTDRLINPVFMQKGYNYCSAVDWECKWKMTKISSCFDLI